MKFEVETNQVSSAVRQMNSTLDAIEKGRGRMYAQIHELDGMWVGEAHDTFAAQYDVDNQQMTRLLNSLKEIATLFDEARQSYDKCEQGAKSKIASIRI